MLEHEVHFLGGYLLCSDDKITFILTIFIIHHNHELTFANIFDCFFNCIHHIYLCFTNIRFTNLTTFILIYPKYFIHTSGLNNAESVAAL